MNESEQLADAVFNAVRDYIAREAGLDLQVLATLHDRVELLEHARTMKFVGPWDPGSGNFRPGDVVQKGAATWVAMAEITGKEVPGSSSLWRRLGTSA